MNTVQLSESLNNTIFGTENFILLDTIGDGSCLFHAIYNSLNKEDYRTKNDDMKKKYVKEKRNELAALYNSIYENKDKNSVTKKIYNNLKQNFYDIRINTEDGEKINKVSDEQKILKINSAYIASSEWAGQEMLKLIRYFEEINIILIDDNSRSFDKTGFRCEGYEESEDSFNISYHKTIFIKLKNRHFEPLVINNPDIYTGIFETKSKLVDTIRKVCVTNKNIIINTGLEERKEQTGNIRNKTTNTHKTSSTTNSHKKTQSVNYQTMPSMSHQLQSTNNLGYNIIIIIILICIILISIGFSVL
jgi:hypothetical protein